ncbi:hypothetical protein HPG69_001413 [Diceros bicornis minor]|uniref:Uncharacterized protein n=1 Tax=Diceros bicornis minor TaxID=77932 RepID=A0A7J7FFE1_DICBM|nr:hypothetical protein HPG69_001413 [Diceros bicornis minor]
MEKLTSIFSLLALIACSMLHKTSSREEPVLFAWCKKGTSRLKSGKRNFCLSLTHPSESQEVPRGPYPPGQLPPPPRLPYKRGQNPSRLPPLRGPGLIPPPPPLHPPGRIPPPRRRRPPFGQAHIPSQPLPLGPIRHPPPFPGYPKPRFPPRPYPPGLPLFAPLHPNRKLTIKTTTTATTTTRYLRNDIFQLLRLHQLFTECMKV